MEWIEFSIRIVTALLLGMMIGAEREWHHRMAGLKTNALVCVGACLYVAFSMMMPNEASPTRVASQVASGIGFLGGGVILRDGMTVRGLTTAATLWCAAAIGTIVGAGYLLHATIGTLVILISNIFLSYVKERFPQVFARNATVDPEKEE